MKKLAVLLLTANFTLAFPAAARHGLKNTIDLMASLSAPTFLCYNPVDNKVYCSMAGVGEEGVAVIDAGLEIFLTKVNTGGQAPGELVYGNGPGRVFVHDNGTTLWAINGASNTMDTSAMFGQGECGLAYNQAENKVYCADWSVNGLTILDGGTLLLLGSVPEIQGNVLFVEPLQRLYGPAGGQIKAVDGVSNAVVDSIVGVNAMPASLMEYNPFNQKLYVTIPGQEDVCIISTVTNTVDTVIQIGITITGLAFCPVNNSVYVTTASIAKDQGGSGHKLPSSLYELTHDNTVNVYGIDDSMLDIVFNQSDNLLYLLCSETPTKMMWLFDPAQQAVVEGVDLAGTGAYRDLTVDSQGDVYACDLWQGLVYVVGQLPGRIWMSDTTSGRWHDPNSWVYSDNGGMSWGNLEMTYPTAADSSILISSGHAITVDDSLTVDELTVNGVLLHFNSVLTVNDGPGMDIAVNGLFRQQTATAYQQAPGSQWVYGPGATHDYQADGDSIPIAVWDSASVLDVRIDNAMSFKGGIGQSFGVINWNWSSSSGFTVATEPGFTARQLNVYSTGGMAPLTICSDLAPEVAVGRLSIGSGGEVLLGSGGTKKLIINGNLNMNNSPPLGLYDPSNPGICTLRVRGDYTYLVAKGGKGLTGPSGPDSAAMVFDGGGDHNILAAGDIVSGFVDFIVEPGNVISIDQAFALGSGSQGRFWLMPGAFLATSHSLGAWVSADSGCIRNTGPRIFGPGAGFIFPDTAQPGIAGDAVAGEVSMIRVGNPYGITLLSSVNVADSLVLQGELATGADTVYLPSGASVSALGGYVQGNLAKQFQIGSENKVFEIGTPAGQYSPLGLQLYNATAPGFITVSAFQGNHPQVDSADNCLRRYWRVSGPGIFCDNSEATLNYLPGDFNINFTELLHESTMVAGRYGNGATPGWSLPAVLVRTYNGPADGGSITLAGGSSFDDSPEFTTGRDAASIHLFADTIPPAAPESLQIWGANPSYWLNTMHTSVPVGWKNPFDSTAIARAFYKTYEPPTGPMDFTDSILAVGGARDTFWLAVDTLNGTMPVHLWLRDGAGNSSYLNNASIIARRDTVAPAGAAVKPFPSDTSYAVNFAVNWSPGVDALSGLQAWRVLFRIDTSAAWDTLAPFHNDTTMVLNGALAGHRYYFEASACDSAYNWEFFTGTAEASVFVAQPQGDTIPPHIVSTSPANGDTGVALGAPVSIQFSEPIRASLFSYSLEPVVGGLAAVWSADSTTVTIGHDDFAPLATYLVSIAAAPDTMGLPLSGPSGFSFTTMFTDTTSPHTAWVTPSDGQTGVGLDQQVVVSFSEPVDPTSFRFTCSPDPGSWDLSWSGGQTVTLGHAPFEFNTTYTLSVDSVADLAGNPMDTSAAPNQPWSFATISGPITLATPWAGGAWRLFSVPMMPQDTSALAMLGDDLGAYSDTTWRLVGYKPNYGYVERPPLWPGYGYWMASVQNANIDVQGTQIYQPQAMPLDSGWNMVGNPFDTAVALSGLRVKWNDGTPHELSYSDSLVNGVLRQVMRQYLDSSADLVNNGYWDSLSPYAASDSLWPWQGCAVYAARPCSLVMERAFKGKPVLNPPPRQMLWQMDISAAMGQWSDRGLVVGVSPQASQGYDRLDAEKPPLVSENLAIHLPHQDWGQGPCRRYLRDVRPPGAEQRWAVRVDAAARLPVAVDFTLAGRLEPQYHLYIVNGRLGQAQEVDGGGRVELDGGGELAVVYTCRGLAELDLKPLAFGLTRVHPNPFRGRTAISYQVDRPGRISLKVYNSLGQLAAVLVDGHREAGFHAAVWDGGRAAAGVYLVRLESEGRSRVTKTVKLR